KLSIGANPHRNSLTRGLWSPERGVSIGKIPERSLDGAFTNDRKHLATGPERDRIDACREIAPQYSLFDALWYVPEANHPPVGCCKSFTIRTMRHSRHPARMPLGCIIQDCHQFLGLPIELLGRRNLSAL